MSGVQRVVFDERLREGLLEANRHGSERIAFLLGRRVGDEARLAAALFPPLTESEPTRAAFDMRWFTILRTTARRLGLEPELEIAAWMHSHPGMSIFLSATDIPTARAFQRGNPEIVAVVVNPFDPTDPIGAFSGASAETRIPVEFRRDADDLPVRLRWRLAALGTALPDFDQLVLPGWTPAPDDVHREAARVLHGRLLEGHRYLAHRLEALAARVQGEARPAARERGTRAALAGAASLIAGASRGLRARRTR